MWKKNKVPAFTLLECLLSLLVLSGSLLVFDGLARLLHQEVKHHQRSQESDWFVFSDQLRSELSGAILIRVENDRLYIDRAGRSLAFGKSKSDDFRKTNDKGQGYQPMLYGVESAKMTEVDGLVTIEVQLSSGIQRTFLYDFKAKS